MSQFLKYAVGIDVSKDSFHVCLSVIDTLQKVTIKSSRSFTNQSKGFQELASWVKSHRKEANIPLVYLMEATGVYHENLAWFLHHLGCHITITLPKKAKYYFKSLGQKSKNDTIDAKGLAQMAAEQNLEAWQPTSPQIEELKALTRHHSNLQEQKTVYNNQIHAIESSHHQDKLVLKDLYELVELMNTKLLAIRKQIDRVVEKDPILKEKFALISPIQGVGTLTIATIVTETNGFEFFENERQLTSYSGYDVTERQSGKFIGKTTISKQGNSRIRKILHLPAFNVVRFKQRPFVNLFERVYERTNLKMKGYVAVQRKLLVLIFSLWKKNEKYDPNKVAPTSEATLDEVQELLLQE
jgi:transposase